MKLIRITISFQIYKIFLKYTRTPPPIIGKNENFVKNKTVVVQA